MSGFWSANLQALSSRPGGGSTLATALARLGPAPDLGLRSRTGQVLPGVSADGRARSLVSTFDGNREAERWADGATGTVAVYGATGRAAVTALRRRGVTLVFTVEPRLELWRSVFTWEDWTELAAWDGWVAVCDTAEVWQATLTERYHPLWDGGFRTLEWRAATAGAEALWDAYRTQTTQVLDTVASDASTQARFAERWYRNTLANLRRLVPGSVAPCVGAHVVIAGAGPGLDDALDDPTCRRWLEARPQTGDKLFSTDTALPALGERGVVPDLVLCLDGQLATYHHFVGARPTGVPLVADLAALPLLGRLGLPLVRYVSGHPFGAIVHRYFPEIPFLDGSLGNVSGLALRAAQALGARRVDTWGVDFSYRDGQAYAHGTYVYALAARRASRLQPLETRLSASCYGAPGLERTWDAQGRALDTTPLLRDYQRRWKEAGPPAAPVVLAHDGSEGRWQAFLEHWRSRLEALPLPRAGASVHSTLRALPPEVQQDWLAVWPLGLALLRQGADREDLPRAVKAKALSFLED